MVLKYHPFPTYASFFPPLQLSLENLLLSVRQGPVARSSLATNSSSLVLGEALGFDCRVVAKAVGLADGCIVQLGSSLAIRTAIDGHDNGTTEAQVVLQAVLGVGSCAVVGPSTQVPDKLGTLRNTRGTQGMALGDEAARGVDDVLAAVGDVAAADELVGLALLTKTEGINDNHLVGAEAVVQLDNLHVFGGDAGLAHGCLYSVLGHLIAHQVNGAAGKQAGSISGQALPSNLDGLSLEVRAGIKELLRDEDGSSASIRGRAALKLGERVEDLGCLHNLVEGIDLLELRVGILGRVGVVDASNLSKVLGLGTILLYVFAASVAEHLSRAGGGLESPGFNHHVDSGADGVLAVVPEALQATSHHLLEAHNHDAVGSTARDEGTGHGQTSAASGAVVVDVVDGNLGHAKLVKDTLTAGAVAVAVAGDALVDIVVVDLSVEESLYTSFESELSVVHQASGLDELGHAHAQDVDGRLLLGRHFDEWLWCLCCGYVYLSKKCEWSRSVGDDGKLGRDPLDDDRRYDGLKKEE